MAHALAAGLPVPVGAIALNQGAFTYHDEKRGTTLSDVMEPGKGNVLEGFALTNTVAATADRQGAVVSMRVRYEYGGTAQPAWFPHVIERDAFLRGKWLTICRFVIYRLDLGVVPQSEFYPDRFLTQ